MIEKNREKNMHADKSTTENLFSDRSMDMVLGYDISHTVLK